MKLRPVKSSHISRVGYDERSKLLVVQFPDGRRYAYPNTSSKKYGEMMSAGSIGSYFNANVRDGKSRRLTPAKAG